VIEDERLDRLVAQLPPIADDDRVWIVELLRPYASHQAAHAA
jgi:hypothetical protein